mgnify:FL=1
MFAAILLCTNTFHLEYSLEHNFTMKPFFLPLRGVILAALSLTFLFALHSAAQAQSAFELKGRVLDQSSLEPLIGATVAVKGSTGAASKGTITNKKGEFALTLDAPTATLQLSYTGYGRKEVSVDAARKYITILMEAGNVAMNEVRVTGYANQRSILETPGSVGVITSVDLQRGNGVQLYQTLNTLPGVRMENRMATGGARIVLRGYGNATNFNGVGYKAYLNDIPLTDADGTTFLDDVDFAILGRVEVLKGPAASLYGMGIGGVVNMYTERAPSGSTSVAQSLMVGSYGLLRSNTTLRAGTDNASFLVNYGYQYYDTFRKHATSTKSFVTINGDFYANECQTASVFVNYTSSYDLLPGQVDSLQLISSPEIAEQAYIANNANVKTESIRAGFSHEYRFSSQFVNRSSIFSAGQIIDQPFAAGVNKTSKVKFGARSVFTFTTAPESPIDARITAGVEVLKNFNFAKGYGLTNGILGALRSDLEVQALQYSAFAQAEVNITPTTLVTAGASLNFIEYTITDMRATTTTPAYLNQSGYKRFTPLITPRVAVTQKVTDEISAYASVSQGYSPPGTNQIVITQIGQVNLDLMPETATSYEIGSKGSVLNKALTYEVAYFIMPVTNKLIPQNFPAANGLPAYTITTNAGRVQHNGLEASVSYALRFDDENAAITLIRPFVTYTLNDFKYLEFKSDNNNNAATKDFSGLRLPGIAPNLVNAGVDVETRFGAYLNTTLMYVDQMPINNSNTNVADAYTLLNARAGWRGKLGDNFALEVYAGSDNMLSAKYSPQIFLNLTAGAGQPLPLFFNPGPKITFYGGLVLKYTF